MKDRMALAMVEGAERDGALRPGMTVIEYTGGSTGPALAFVCGAKGYRARIVISTCFTEERRLLMLALGAELELVDAVVGPGTVTPADIQRMIDRAAELAAADGHYATDQFRNPYVAPGFRDTLGREIWDETGGRLAVFCMGVGTSGCVMGVAEVLKSRRRDVRVVAIEPAGSPAISGGPPGSFVIQGWTGIVPPLYRPELVDEVATVSDEEAVEMAARLAREEGIFAGISTGANVVVANRIAASLGRDEVVVTIAVDSGFKYMGGPPYGDGRA
jgi:cysteine synthase A